MIYFENNRGSFSLKDLEFVALSIYVNGRARF